MNTGTAVPSGFICLAEAASEEVLRRLGYFGGEPIVLFSYHLDAHALIWKDGRTSGFSGGGCDYFLDTLVPLALRRGARLADQTDIGVHVIVVDRDPPGLYAAPRHCAEEFLAVRSGQSPPKRRCLCARPPESSASLPRCTGCLYRMF